MSFQAFFPPNSPQKNALGKKISFVKKKSIYNQKVLKNEDVQPVLFWYDNNFSVLNVISLQTGAFTLPTWATLRK